MISFIKNFLIRQFFRIKDSILLQLHRALEFNSGKFSKINYYTLKNTSRYTVNACAQLHRWMSHYTIKGKVRTKSVFSAPLIN